MNWISTTIKRKHIDKILSGEKTSEYKVYNDFWKKRLNKYRGIHHDDDLGINFLCGQKAYKFDVRFVALIHLIGFTKEIDGEETKYFYDIGLGEQLKEAKK